MDKRFLLTLAVCFTIMAVWQTFVMPPPKKSAPAPNAPASAPAATNASTPTNAPAQTGAISAAPREVALSPSTMSASAPHDEPRYQEKKASFSTPLYTAEFSTTGAAITDFTLKNYKEGGRRRAEEKHPVSLVGRIDDTPVATSVVLVGGEPMRFDDVSSDADGVRLERRGNDLAAQAIWRAEREDYLLSLEVSLQNNTGAPLSVEVALLMNGVFNEATLKNKGMFDPQPELVRPIALGDDKTHYHALGKKDELGQLGRIRWGGIDRQYFLFAAAPIAPPAQSLQFDEARFNETREAHPASLVRLSTALKDAPKTLGAGEKATFSYKVYAGPKTLSLLKAPGLGLDEAVDYNVWGMPLAFLSRPMLWVLKTAYGFFHNYGIAILILTLIVKLLMLPVTQKSYESMQVMKELKPELDKIKERYPNDREKQGMETMRLYRERKVNPFLSGCLPALLQMPVYLALWRTLSVAVELYQQEFLWLGDLTAKDPYYILPLLLGAMMVVQQKLSPPMGDPQQQKMMLFVMPPMMTLFMVALPSGLVFYILVNTVLTIIQQVYISKKFAHRNSLSRQTA